MPPRTPPPAPTVEERRNARVLLNRLKKRYPEMGTALDYGDGWQLLVATVLSAQTTDDMVNKVTPTLFDRWPTPLDLANANVEEVEQVVYSTGFYRQKAKSIVGLAAAVVEEFDGQIPQTISELTALPGVGRKTASVVMAEAFGLPAIAVDTHVKRVSNRLGLVDQKDPVKIEYALQALHPEKEWAGISMRYIQFGRDVCDAKKPRCFDCELSDRCAFTPKALRPE